MSRNIFRLLFSVVLMMCCAMMANAQLVGTLPNDEIWYTTTDGKVCDPWQYGAFGGTYQNNTYVDGKGVIKFSGNVTSIGENAFYSCTNLTSITIPESVENIGDCAFQFCSSLISITIPESVVSIGYRAFDGCSSLTSITIPESVESIGDGAFNGCYFISFDIKNTELAAEANDYWGAMICNNQGLVIKDNVVLGCAKWATSVTIPNSVTSIGDFAFQFCSSLTSITIPESVVSIGDRAFYGCYFISFDIKNTVLAASAEVNDYWGAMICNNQGLVIKDNVVLGCAEWATSVTIPNSVTSIGDWAFAGCSSLTSITIPNSVTSIANEAFFGCLNVATVSWDTDVNPFCLTQYCHETLKEITIGEHVTSIGDFAFQFCSSLTSITIPESVENIGDRAFEGCSSLTSITIPNSVTSIANEAFDGCKNVTTISWDTDVNPFCLTQYCRETLKEITIGEHVTSIGDCAFQFCSSLTSITIPESVENIGDRAFEGCYFISFDIKNTVLAAEVEDNNYWGARICNNQGLVIKDNVVVGCAKWVTSVTIPNSVTSIANGAFEGCSSLTSITIPESVVSIGDRAFYKCLNVTTVSWDTDVNPFCLTQYCSETLKEITIGEHVTSIGDCAFQFCFGLTSITIPESVVSIGDGAFNGCSSLTSITIPESVESIGDGAFEGCSSLTSITIPDSVTSIGVCAFQSCSGLTSITIPESVVSIGDGAFNGCYFISFDIKNTVLAAEVEDNNYWGARICNNQGLVIKDNVVVGCAKWATSVTIPESVESIGDGAFEGCYFISFDIKNTELAASAGANDYWGAMICNNQGLVIKDNVVVDCAIWATSVTIPNSVTSIGDWAFAGCSSLTSITIPESVTSIGAHAFEDCTSLTSIIIYSSEPPIVSEESFYTMLRRIITIYVPDVSKYEEWVVSYFLHIEDFTIDLLKQIAIEKINDRMSGMTLSDEDKEKIVGYIKQIEDADSKDVIELARNAAFAVINYHMLRTEKDEAIAELQDFVENIANAPMGRYTDIINSVTTQKEIKYYVDGIKTEINKSKKITLGVMKYLLDGNNDILTIVGGKLTITDKDLYQSDYNFTINDKFTYSRTFKDANWQALYVPFAMKYSDWTDKFDVATISNFHEYTDENGKTVKTELEVKLVKNGMLKPNHPYLIRAKYPDEHNPQSIELSTSKIYKSDVNSIDCSSVEWKYTFTGTYQEKTELKTMDCIFMSGGRLCKAEDDDISLSPQRWYMTVESRGSQIDTGGTLLSKALLFDIKLLPDETTGIDKITITKTPLQNNDDAIYNINGMRVNENYKGIVIKNGKMFYQE